MPKDRGANIETATGIWTLPGALMVPAAGWPPDEPRLRGGKCTGCGAEFFPWQPVCHACWSEQIVECAMPTEGRLYAFSVVHVARKGWRTPYVIAYVDLTNGVRVSAPLDCDPKHPPRHDSPVRLTVGEIGRTDDGRAIMSHQFKAR